MAWVVLVIAGLFEVAWAVGLKHTEGFTKPIPSVLTVGAIVTSLVLLAHAVRTLPMGTAYAVWVGIGAFGAAVLGVMINGEPISFARGIFLGMLIVAIIGLKATSTS